MDSIKIKYIDMRPLYFPRLDFYSGGLILPNDTNIINVSKKEEKNLLKIMNGKKRCFEKIKEVKE